MMLRLFLLFTIVPTLDLFLLLQIGAWLGPTNTLLVVLLTGLLGAWLAKREGLGLLRQLMQELSQGIPPGVRLMEGALVLAGGLLLITPGVVTDLTGFLIIMPPIRRRIAPIALRMVTSRIGAAAAPPPPMGDAPREAPPRAMGRPTPFSNPFDD